MEVNRPSNSVTLTFGGKRAESGFLKRLHIHLIFLQANIRKHPTDKVRGKPTPTQKSEEVKSNTLYQK